VKNKSSRESNINNGGQSVRLNTTKETVETKFSLDNNVLHF